MTIQKPFSEDTAKLIDTEVRELVEEQYERAKTLLTANRKHLDEVAALLLSKEIIYKEDIEGVLGARPLATSPNESHKLTITEYEL